MAERWQEMSQTRFGTAEISLWNKPVSYLLRKWYEEKWAYEKQFLTSQCTFFTNQTFLFIRPRSRDVLECSDFEFTLVHKRNKENVVFGTWAMRK